MKLFGIDKRIRVVKTRYGPQHFCSSWGPTSINWILHRSSFSLQVRPSTFHNAPPPQKHYEIEWLFIFKPLTPCARICFPALLNLKKKLKCLKIEIGIFLNAHLGYSLNFTVDYHCLVMGGISCLAEVKWEKPEYPE